MQYIECSNCSKKIYKNDECYTINGYCYACCSASCLLYVHMGNKITVLNDRVVKRAGNEFKS